ncbi:MAG: hypothetical protein U0835_10355 [Isosphaeraceae bacterium]
MSRPYCTDEDAARRAPSDYALIVPAHQCLARVSDGVFADGSPWVVTSASTDFQASGVTAGNVAVITGPKPWKSPGELLAVGSVSGHSLTLRRVGFADGTGHPPGKGGASGVVLSVPTFGPQIAAASYDLDRRYGVEDLIVGRRRSDLFDPAELREATLLTMLVTAYVDASRGTADPTLASQGGRPDVWSAKASTLRRELEALLSRVVVHWRPAGNDGSILLDDRSSEVLPMTDDQRYDAVGRAFLDSGEFDTIAVGLNPPVPGSAGQDFLGPGSGRGSGLSGLRRPGDPSTDVDV